MRRTQVCLTVDTEFSIGGAFANPDRYRPVGTRRVTCPVGDKEHGLGFLLDTFRACNIPATFFIEALNVHYFGDDEMGAIARRVAAAGHDTQLHLHPMWRVFRDENWSERVKRQEPDDSLVGRPKDENKAIIAEGLAAFARWGLAPPIALRAGNFQVDSTVYAAMAETPLRLASSVGLGAHVPDAPALQQTSGFVWHHGILEVPALTYRSPSLGGSAPRRVLGIGSTSLAEFKSLLWAAHRADIGPVIIVIHPFLLAKTADPQMQVLARNRLVQNRLNGLCKFLQENAAAFEPTTFGAAAARWLDEETTSHAELAVGAFPAFARMVANRLNDAI